MKTTALLLSVLIVAGCEKLPDPPKGQSDGAATVRSPAEALALGVDYLRSRSKDGIWFVEYDGKQIPDQAFTAMAATAVARSLPQEQRKDDPLVKSATAFVLKALQESGAISTGGISKYENYYTSAGLMLLTTVGDPAHAAVVEKMKGFILSLQRKDEDRTRGGFGYNTAKGADLSNAQYAIEALRSAGVPAKSPEMQEALKFLERAQNRSENDANKGASYEFEDKTLGKIKVVPGNDGSAGYEPGVSKAGMRKLPDGTYVPRGYGSMTYALLKCYLLVGVKPDDARVQAAVKWLGDNYTWAANPGFEDVAKEQNRPEATKWGLFYYYLTAAKALRLMGVDRIDTPQGKRDWRVDLGLAIASRQAPDGSWINTADRWKESDPVLVTSYAVLALQEIASK